MTHLQGMASDAQTLTGKLLVAMPGMGDPRFDRSVIFMCSHGEDGALGLIVNKPTPSLSFAGLLQQLDIAGGTTERDIRVHFGGPVENGRGFVLHSAEYGANRSTLRVGEAFGMTATLDILEDIAHGGGPEDAILTLGYSGWGPGQLEDEILANGWLTCDASRQIVFETEDDAKWSAALGSIGVDPLTLSSTAGRA
ncbi:YqgE/AlgH family protein [Kangsaoukella pontilimi]|nr:YqgE/AlgH family protein [Kangsaoukella pontilimi]